MIKFTKMEGLGNDYVYIDCTKQDIKQAGDLAKFVSNRHFGIGSDGLILIKKSSVADFKMQMFNSDGSEAEMCGNGIRCVGKFVYDKGLTNKESVTVETLAGIKELKLNIKDGRVKTVRVNMGEPILESEEIPIKNGKTFKSKDNIEFYKVNVGIGESIKELTCISMGNPHAIDFINSTKELKIEECGPIIEKDEHFPNKVNAEFIEIVNKNYIKMRVWERGAEETLACGTGACASVVASYLNGYTDRNVTVELLGGNLDIEWSDDNHIYMTGPATTVFEGELIEGK